MRLPAISRKRGFKPISAGKPHKTRLSVQNRRRGDIDALSANWSVQFDAVSDFVNSAARAGGPAEDLSSARVEDLIAEVLRLRAEVHQDRLVIDDLLDRQAMYVNAACMEQLAPVAQIERLGAQRARHISQPAADTTAPAPLETTGVA